MPWTPLGALPPGPRYRLALPSSPWAPHYQIASDAPCLFVVSSLIDRSALHYLASSAERYQRHERNIFDHMSPETRKRYAPATHTSWSRQSASVCRSVSLSVCACVTCTLSCNVDIAKTPTKTHAKTAAADTAQTDRAGLLHEMSLCRTDGRTLGLLYMTRVRTLRTYLLHALFHVPNVLQ